MKIITFYFDNLIIEIHNSLMGKETVIANGVIVSSKFSFFGARHDFAINDDNYTLAIFPGIYGFQYDLFCNKLPMIESTKNGCMLILLLSISLAALFFLIGRIF